MLYQHNCIQIHFKITRVKSCIHWKCLFIIDFSGWDIFLRCLQAEESCKLSACGFDCTWSSPSKSLVYFPFQLSCSVYACWSFTPQNEPSESDALCSLLCISPGSYLACVILLPLLQVVSVKSEKLIDWMAAGFRTCWVFDYFSGRERIVCSKSFVQSALQDLCCIVCPEDVAVQGC